jgi:hypothetical protein
MNRKELKPGERYGRWTVISDEYHKGKYLCVKCHCDCGKNSEVFVSALLNGRSKSCGCLHSEIMHNVKAHYKHGFAHKERLYNEWKSMKQRCYNQNTNRYYRYGGRGVTVCKEWMDSYIAFREWAINNGYDDMLTIDRIDVNGNYCPENCRWVSIATQNRNKSNNVWIEFNGERHVVADWAKIKGLSIKLLEGRLYDGWSVERALNTPRRIIK